MQKLVKSCAVLFGAGVLVMLLGQNIAFGKGLGALMIWGSLIGGGWLVFGHSEGLIWHGAQKKAYSLKDCGRLPEPSQPIRAEIELVDDLAFEKGLVVSWTREAVHKLMHGFEFDVTAQQLKRPGQYCVLYVRMLGPGQIENVYCGLDQTTKVFRQPQPLKPGETQQTKISLPPLPAGAKAQSAKKTAA